MAAQQEQPTPYDLIRPTYPLTWDSTVFNRFDTTVTNKHNMVPKNRTPASYAPNALIPDTLNQAYLDAINVRMSPIRVNQAGYLESDLERQFYVIGNESSFEVVDVNGQSLSPAVTGTLKPAPNGETPSKWREEAEWRRDNWSWLRHSQKIAVKVLLQMKQEGLTQKALAERMNCTQQYVSKILKGKENMSLDTLSKLEDALGISLIYDEQVVNPSMVAEEVFA